MIASEAFPVTYQGKPAQIRVLRNNAHCWGRLILKNGREFDIPPAESADKYDCIDEDAAEYFERRMNRGHVEPAMGSWRFGWADSE